MIRTITASNGESLGQEMPSSAWPIQNILPGVGGIGVQWVGVRQINRAAHCRRGAGFQPGSTGVLRSHGESALPEARAQSQAGTSRDSWVGQTGVRSQSCVTLRSGMPAFSSAFYHSIFFLCFYFSDFLVSFLDSDWTVKWGVEDLVGAIYCFRIKGVEIGWGNYFKRISLFVILIRDAIDFG